MSEEQVPPLRLMIQGLRWLGDEFGPVREAVEFTLNATDQGDSADILRLLRENAQIRMDMHLFALSAGREALNFNAPNQPTENDLDGMVQHAEHLLAAVRVLRELAPEVISDDEEDGDE